MYRYTIKRLWRNWRLFLAILIGILVGTTLFASANIGGTAILSAMLDRTLQDVPVDMTYSPNEFGIHGFPNSTSLPRYQETIESVDGVIGTEVVVSHYNYTWDDGETYQITTGISANSAIYNGISHVEGATSLGVNETYILTSSSQLSDYPVGSNYTLAIRIDRWPQPPLLLNLTLTVVGHVEMTDAAFFHMMGGYWYWSPWWDHNFFIVDLDQTMLPILDYVSNEPNFDYMDLHTEIYIFLDRFRIINPFDISSSILEITQIEQQINNLLGFGQEIYNQLSFTLLMFNSMAESQKLSFLMISMPVFFIALYMGITLNDVSFSLRRREVGLYLSKGQTRGQITSMFVAEGFFIGILASILGFGLAFLLVPFFIGIGTYIPLNPLLVGFDTIFLTFAFGIGLALMATYFPARKAVEIPTTEALREYTLVGEPIGYPKLLAWMCLGLGTYKLIVWILGINITAILYSLIITNPMIAIAVSIWAMVDAVLGFWAPLLFLYGLTTILIKGSTRFHDYATRLIRRIMGDLGAIAAHTIRRQPGRTAAVIFLSALLVGYSVQTVGIIASQKDLVIRQIYTSTGADLKINVRYTDNATNMLSTIRGIPGVQGATSELTFSLPTTAGTTETRAINVSEWINVAYWEPGWFRIQPAHIALDALASDNQTIILERLYAVQLDLAIGSSLRVDLPTVGYQSFTVAGYFGPEPANLGGMGWAYWMAEPTWSYISQERLSELVPGVSPTGYILVSLTSPTVNDAVVDAIEALDDIRSVESSLDILEEFNSDVFLNSTVNMMQMGLLFAFLLASLGTVVVVYLTLRERRRSTALMSARGMTYMQTVRILMAESLTMMGFAILIGLFVGFIVLYGLVQSGSFGFLLSPALLVPRFLPPTFLTSIILQLGAVVGLLLLATIIPILIEAYTARYDLSILR